jgi:hypothetical protein
VIGIGRKSVAGSRKPNSVPRPAADAAARGDDHSSSSDITGGIKRPTRRLRTGRPDDASLFGLAPCGVLPATCVAAHWRPPRALRRFGETPRGPRSRTARCALTAPFHPYSPPPSGLRRSKPRGLPAAPRRTDPRACHDEAPKARSRAVCFLCHFPSGCPDRVLPGALPCGVRTFLSSPASPAARTPQDDRGAAIAWLPATSCQTTRRPGCASARTVRPLSRALAQG